MKLKYYFLSFALAAAFLTGFTSCSDDDDDPVPADNKLTLSENEARIKIGDEFRMALPVATGAGAYHAYSLNPSIADVVQDEDGQYYVTGLRNGFTSVVISDANSEYARFKVTVYTTEHLLLSHDMINLEATLGRTVTNTDLKVTEGNNGYSVSSDNNRVTASINEDGEVTLTGRPGVQEETATVTVTDLCGFTATATVVLTPNLNPFTDEQIQRLLTAEESMISYRNDYPWYFDASEKEMFTRTADNFVSTGWEWDEWAGLTSFYVKYPAGTGLNEVVDGQLVIHQWDEDDITDGKVKIIADNAERFVALFYKIDEQREIIYSGYVVWVK